MISSTVSCERSVFVETHLGVFLGIIWYVVLLSPCHPVPTTTAALPVTAAAEVVPSSARCLSGGDVTVTPQNQNHPQTTQKQTKPNPTPFPQIDMSCFHVLRAWLCIWFGGCQPAPPRPLLRALLSFRFAVLHIPIQQFAPTVQQSFHHQIGPFLVVELELPPTWKKTDS